MGNLHPNVARKVERHPRVVWVWKNGRAEPQVVYPAIKRRGTPNKKSNRMANRSKSKKTGRAFT